MTAIRLGTRGSRLALVQSELVAERLRAAGQEVVVVPMVTEGDVRPIDMSPGEGVFVAAIARALLSGKIDLAVHSAKDVPLEEDAGLVIAAYPERADPRDALVTPRGGGSLESLPRGAVVGTDSPRRTGFLLAARPASGASTTGRRTRWFSRRPGSTVLGSKPASTRGLSRMFWRRRQARERSRCRCGEAMRG